MCNCTFKQKRPKRFFFQYAQVFSFGYVGNVQFGFSHVRSSDPISSHMHDVPQPQNMITASENNTLIHMDGKKTHTIEKVLCASHENFAFFLVRRLVGCWLLQHSYSSTNAFLTTFFVFIVKFCLSLEFCVSRCLWMAAFFFAAHLFVCLLSNDLYMFILLIFGSRNLLRWAWACVTGFAFLRIQKSCSLLSSDYYVLIQHLSTRSTIYAAATPKKKLHFFHLTFSFLRLFCFK